MVGRMSELPSSARSEGAADCFSVIVRVQMLAELEEIISYKDHAAEPDRQATQRQTWQKRLVSHRALLMTDYTGAREMWKFGSGFCRSDRLFLRPTKISIRGSTLPTCVERLIGSVWLKRL
jgi:hypothetical protein